MRIWIRMKTEQDTKETCLAVSTWKTEIYTSKWSFKGNDSIILTTIIQAQKETLYRLLQPVRSASKIHEIWKEREIMQGIMYLATEQLLV